MVAARLCTFPKNRFIIALEWIDFSYINYIAIKQNKKTMHARPKGKAEHGERNRNRGRAGRFVKGFLQEESLEVTLKAQVGC